MVTANDLDHIRRALDTAGDILRPYIEGGIEVSRKAGGDPVTEADLAVDTALKEFLPAPGDGWLSEETVDDPVRLKCSRVWIVDPLDGTKEFVTGIPEWCVSIGLIEDGQPMAGGIYNPATDELVVGAVGQGVTFNGKPAHLRETSKLSDALVLASRSEVKRGVWDHYDDDAFVLKPTGSVAYKLGMVAAGQCDATWTLVPKNEWDVAAGAALVLAAGGHVYTVDWETPVFNRPDPLMKGLIAITPTLAAPVRRLLS